MTTLSHYMELNGKRYLLSDQDHLLDLETWDPEICNYIANRLGIQLSEDHIEVIKLIRESYQDRKKHPYVRVVTADMAEKMGAEKGNMRFFYNLFPKGIHQAFQLAGLPMQGFCF